jgi:hypothetical protein
MPGAVMACQSLAEAGHELACVSSMPPRHASARLVNLQNLGFPINQVIATGQSCLPDEKPKRQAILKLQPDSFVDDELRKLKNLDKVRLVLVDPGHSDCPNRGQSRQHLAMEVPDLQTFAQRFLSLPTHTFSKKPMA